MKTDIDADKIIHETKKRFTKDIYPEIEESMIEYIEKSGLEKEQHRIVLAMNMRNSLIRKIVEEGIQRFMKSTHPLERVVAYMISLRTQILENSNEYSRKITSFMLEILESRGIKKEEAEKFLKLQTEYAEEVLKRRQ